MKINLEEELRKHVRQLLDEAVALPVDLAAGSALYDEMKLPAVSGDEAKLKLAIKNAIKVFKLGDRADQKLADNLRAFQGSVKARPKHPDWRIVELGFAEWRNRKKLTTQSPGSKNESLKESKKTELERIYEQLETIARRDNVKVFDLVDRLMVGAEKELNSGPTSCNSKTPEVPLKPKLDPSKPTSGAEMHQQATDTWGFMHQDKLVKDPFYDCNGNEVDPVDHYGDSFLNSKFPFAFGDITIVDPRYDETGELDVNPEEHYGDAFRGSDYFKLFKERS